MDQSYLPFLNIVSQKMIPHFYVLGFGMEHLVLGNAYGTSAATLKWDMGILLTKVTHCRCLNLSTSIGGTRSKVGGGDRHDLEPEGTREDTRHKIYTGSDRQGGYPTSCLEYYIVPCA
jgi:hypothetical protein